MHASLDIPPYYYIQDNKVVQAPTDSIAAHYTEGVTPIQGEFWRAGKIAPDFKHEEVLPKFTQKSIEFLHKQKKDRPFFLYLALAAPHTPWLPSESFQGQSRAGMYGDFTAQVDDNVGKVLKAIDDLGLTDNTLVFFVSDNGPVWYKQDEKKYDHQSTSFLRGMKADDFEGGHRMPFIARWPGHIPAGKTTDEVICFTDMLATFAAVAGDTLPPDAGEDSYNILPVLLDKSYPKPLREATVIGKDVIIKGQWKLIIGSGYGGISTRYSPELQAKSKREENSGKLFNIVNDPSETRNLYDEYPDIVKQMKQLLQTYKQQGKSVTR
ncbi:MAG: sulfatase-like hydrolase/transferase [candidate division KSB1 bacterium]|nr:sulfatase-like hydrolase/transferase [candidate division KSB1 bacterium]